MATKTILIYPDYEALSRAAAEQFAVAATTAVEKRGRFLAALSGGGTPIGLFHHMATAPVRERIPWAKVHLFWCDERCVPADDPGSNYFQADHILISKVPIPKGNVHRIPGELPPEQAVAETAEELRRFADPGSDLPRLDLALLGLGEDGHVASIFPGVHDPLEWSALVIHTRGEYQGRPAQRITLTPMTLSAARQVVFLVSGDEKAEALAGSLEGEPDPLRWPAQRIRPTDGEVIWLVDEAAARLLRKR
jgi:6-phosphogluconolactonase